MTAENLNLWNHLKRTDPKATKPFTRAGGFRGSQIDPVWRMQMMTEQFGPVGKGWGYEQLEWTTAERMIFVCLRAWYRDPDTGEQCWTGPQWGGTEMVRRRRDGAEYPDDECFKMSVTDALGKCLLQIGLAADVHMGEFDDSKYREESDAYYRAKENGAGDGKAIAAFKEEIGPLVASCNSLDDLDELWRSGVSAKIKEIGLHDKSAQAKLIEKFSMKKAELLRLQDEGVEAV